MQLGGAGEEENLQVVGRRGDHRLEQVTGCLEVLVQIGKACLEVAGLRIVRVEFLKPLELGLGGGPIATSQEDFEDARVRRQPVRARGQRLSLRLQCRVAVALDEEQQVALELKGLIVGRLLGKDAVEQSECRIAFARARLQPRAGQQRRAEVGR